MKQPVIAALASGSGTTVEAFIRASHIGQIDPQVGLVITNNKDAGVLERIAQLNKELNLSIETRCINKVTHPAAAEETVTPGAQTQAEEAALLELLRAGGFSAVVLMGYMKKVGSRLVKAFGWRPEYKSPYQAMMLNTHPGLLPATKGWYGVYVQEHVLKSGLKEAGQTLHVVAKDYDDGPVIAENKLAVRANETAEALFARVQALEKQSLPHDVAKFIQERQQYIDLTSQAQVSSSQRRLGSSQLLDPESSSG